MKRVLTDPTTRAVLEDHLLTVGRRLIGSMPFRKMIRIGGGGNGGGDGGGGVGDGVDVGGVGGVGDGDGGVGDGVDVGGVGGVGDGDGGVGGGVDVGGVGVGDGVGGVGDGGVGGGGVGVNRNNAHGGHVAIKEGRNGLRIIPSQGSYYPYVSVGWVTRSGDELTVENNRIIAYFGRDKFLSDLAVNGPAKDTKLGAAVTEDFWRPHILRCLRAVEEKWKKECPRPTSWPKDWKEDNE